LNLRAATQPIKFFADRRGGFDSEINVRLVGGQADDFILDGVKFRHDSNEVVGTLSVLKRGGEYKFEPVYFEAVVSTAAGVEIFPVIAADNYEQAFIYHHLIQAENLFVVRPRNWQIQQSLGFVFKDVEADKRDDFFSVTIIPDGRSEIHLPFINKRVNKKNTQKNKSQKEQTASVIPQVDLSKVSFELTNAPEGITLEDAVLDKKELKLTFAATKDVPKNASGNLIIKVNLNSNQKKQTTQSLGTLPTINFTVENP
jgi:hypothetical protein